MNTKLELTNREVKNMNYYDEIRNKIIDNEIYSKVKDHSKERNTVITYFEIGRNPATNNRAPFCKKLNSFYFFIFDWIWSRICIIGIF